MGPVVKVSGRIETGGINGVLEFDGIKVHRMTGGLVLFHISRVM